MKLLRKKEVFKVKSVPLDPSSIVDPTRAEEFCRRGTAYYARKQFELAINDFKTAISLDGNMVDAYYGLGMVLKASNQKEGATAAFTKVVDLVAINTVQGKVNANMLRRLALGHVNELTEGDWNLEKEIWKHSD
jgi:lipoprotein NlpI